jgi:hypothetical protein
MILPEPEFNGLRSFFAAGLQIITQAFKIK